MVVAAALAAVVSCGLAFALVARDGGARQAASPGGSRVRRVRPRMYPCGGRGSARFAVRGSVVALVSAARVVARSAAARVGGPASAPATARGGGPAGHVLPAGRMV